ncbi:HAMP domain-containing histidine kinase [Microbacterium sp. LRZ72]|uniref:sensor histidine kinase n=1 Tax=Microbacterium sp. LRZ72 TaxID=2942481 RepID=UPI0029A44EB1|nr:HAMP domain-containing sensor histidine kinase [Microbacterium sp. LRZ72]MDX2376050.1 HAMP domain-containing histidine kinase [Microbacterium sp. LRZ72]
MTSSASHPTPRRLPAPSVRTRIIAVITIVAALGMASVGAAVYAVERTRILAQIDDRLDAGLESARFLVAQGVTDDDWSTSTEALAAVVQRMSPDDNTGALGIIDGEAALAPGISLDVDLQEAAGFVPHVVEATANGQPVTGVYAEDGVTWQYLAAPIAIEGSPEPAETLFTMAYDIEGELAEINVAAQVYLIAAAIAVVVIAGVAWFVAGRLLRPVRTMRETAERVSAHSLSERLPIEGRDDVSELAETMNAMLDRLDESLESQRRLLHDVGHELKTPITIVRGYVEVMDPDDPADVRETQALTVDELDRMGNLVQDLARSASLHGPRPISPRPVDTADLVRQIVSKAERIEGADVAAGPAVDVVAVLDPERITQAMLQLAQNGVTHGGGGIVIGSRRVGDDLELWVRDYGPGVADAEKERVFERFQRGADDTRAGSGLGLNIVQVIARAHGGTAEVRDADGGGAVFVLTLPIAAPLPQRPPLPTESATPATTVPLPHAVAHGSATAPTDVIEEQR